MKFNQYLLIFMAVAIMCLFQGEKPNRKRPQDKNKEENLSCHRKKHWQSLLASHFMALRWIRKMNPTEVTLLF